MTVAALYVAEYGPYVNRSGVDAWPEKRDARLYRGPWSVVAHPPCNKWGFAARMHGTVGQDGGCFQAALQAVREYGGVIEHPRGSEAWRHFGLPIPKGRGWSAPDAYGGRSCYVDQGAYGHKAKKPTWLYAVLPSFPKLDWTRVWGRPKIGGEGFHGKLERARKKARSDFKPQGQQVSQKEATITPPAFAEVLLGMARSCEGWKPAGPRHRLVKLELGGEAGA
ncbi:MAG: hypothetical protein ACYC2H_10000 [Thermoplasmatota archaeon]